MTIARGVIGARAKASFVVALREFHPELYEKLGRPDVWTNRSLQQGVELQKLVFSQKPVLGPEANLARIHLRRVTVAVISALVLVTGLGLAMVLSMFI